MNRQELFKKLFKNSYLIDATTSLSYALVRLIPVVYDAKLNIWITDSSRPNVTTVPYKIDGTIVGFMAKNKNQAEVFINYHKNTFLKNPIGCARYCEEDGEELLGEFYGCW